MANFSGCCVFLDKQNTKSIPSFLLFLQDILNRRAKVKVYVKVFVKLLLILIKLGQIFVAKTLLKGIQLI